MSGRAVIVTGGAGGIGAGITEGFLHDGDRVAIADVNLDAAEGIAEGFRSQGLPAIAVQVDITSPDSALAMAKAVEAEFGTIEVLVNNAGLFGNPAWTGPVLQMPAADWIPMFEVNVHGIAIMSQAVAPVMAVSGWGRIVNISSMGAFMLGGVYSASKLAVHHLTWSLATELGDSGITVNCVAPGTMDTPSNHRNSPDRERVERRAREAFIVKRLGKPADIYAAVKYFASAEAEWCTGQSLVVNGGMSVHL